MKTLTVGALGRLVLGEDVLRHLRAVPGDTLDTLLLPGGRVELRASSWESWFAEPSATSDFLSDREHPESQPHDSF